MSLASLYGKLVGWFGGPEQAFGTPALKRTFRTENWTVHDASTNNLAFFVEDATIGMFAVCVSPREPSRELLLDLTQQASEQRTRVILVTAGPMSPDRLRDARDRGLVPIRADELSQLRTTIAGSADHRQAAMRDAKMAARSQLPPAPPRRSLELTEEQRDRGFFYRTDQVAAFFVDRGGDELLVTFAEWASPGNGAAQWGEAFGLIGDFSVLGFQVSEPTWYPHTHMVDCVSAAAAKLGDRFPVRIAIGSSQGGYAAIRYSGALAAAAVLAFSPQYSIDPAILSDARFGGYYRASLNSGMHIKADDVAGTVAVAFDPKDEVDRLQARKIIVTVGAHSMELPFSGHGAGHLLGQADLIIAMLRKLLEADVPAAHRLAVLRRHTNRARPYLMAQYLSGSRPRLALSLFLTYRDRYPEFNWYDTCFRLSNAGLGLEVLEWLKAEAASKPADASAHTCLALVALATAQLDTAFDAVSHAAELEPGAENVAYILGLIVTAREGQTRV